MKDTMPYIYIVDDNRVSLKVLQKKIRDVTAYRVRTFSSAEECLRVMEFRTPELVLTDLHLDSEAPGNMNGDRFMRIIHQLHPKLPVIIFSTTDSIKTVSKLIREGAKYFIPRDRNFLKEVSRITVRELRDKPSRRMLTRRELIVFSFLMLLFMIVIDLILWKYTFPWLSIISALLITSWVARKLRKGNSQNSTSVHITDDNGIINQ